MDSRRRRSRKSVLTAIRKLGCPTAREIVAYVRKYKGDISGPTVYKRLAELESEGAIESEEREVEGRGQNPSEYTIAEGTSKVD